MSIPHQRLKLPLLQRDRFEKCFQRTRAVRRFQRFLKHRKSAALLAGLNLLALSAGNIDAAEPAAGKASRGSAPKVMPPLIERYATDLAALQRRYNVTESTNRAVRLRRYYERYLQQLDALDFEALDQDGRIDYLLFRNKLRFELRDLDHEQQRRTEVSDLVPFAPVIIRLEETRRNMEPIGPEQSAKAMTEISNQVAEKRERIEERLKASKDTLPAGLGKVAGNRAAREVDDLRQTLQRWHDFYSGYDPVFAWWANEAYRKADKALGEYADYLRRKLAGSAEGEDTPIIGDPIGRPALLDALEAEMIPYTPEELIEIADREFAWCEAEQQRAARELGFGDDWSKALDYVSQRHVPPGEQPSLIKRLADEATQFVERHDLVTVPELCKETWHIEMMSPERQKVNPYFTGGEVLSVSYPTATMSYEDKLMSMRGNNIHFSRATVHHEVIPGHHLQLFMAARYQTHRRIFRTPFLVEGWALYWEMLLWDLKFPQSPEDRVGMLFWRSHRCARIIFSLNFHLGKMTAPEAVDFLVKRVGHERRNAVAEVRRSVAGEYGPLYQAAYMLGGLQIRAMRRELVESGQMTNRAFHDAILKENAIPIEMIRASLERQPLHRDSTSRWRFYDLNSGKPASR